MKALKCWLPGGCRPGVCRKVGEVGEMRKETTIAAYVYVFIVKKLKDHIKNSKYYETDNLKTGGHCWHYIAHLSARAHTYIHLRHEESKAILTAGLGRIFEVSALLYWEICQCKINFHQVEIISLNHALDWKKLFEHCKTHQDNFSDKD